MSPYVMEYIARSRLVKLGFTSDFDSLPYIKTEIFCAIDATIDNIKAEEAKKMSLKKR